MSPDFVDEYRMGVDQRYGRCSVDDRLVVQSTVAVEHPAIGRRHLRNEQTCIVAAFACAYFHLHDIVLP